MRKILISMLLAGAAASPAWAAPDYSTQRAERQAARESRQSARTERQSTREDRSSTRDERQSTREERSSARADRQTAREQVQVQRSSVAPVQLQQSRQLQQSSPRAARDVRIEQRTARQRSADRPTQTIEQVNGVQVIRDTRADRRQQNIDQSTERLQQIRDARRNAPPPIVSNTPSPNTQPPPPTTSRGSSSPQWNHNWRNNSRYDWNHHRRRHRSLFHLGFYFDPFGWGYNPFQIGWRMWPSYYGSSYWLNDPWQYRLPYAPPGTRWIRYYNDAILVDLWSGQVIDVIYSFFW